MRHIHSVFPTWWASEWASGVPLMVRVVYNNPLEREFLILKDIMLNEGSCHKSPPLLI